MNLQNNEKPIGVLKIKLKGAKYVVTFDEDIEITFTADQMVTYRISLDKRFTAEEIETIKKSANFDLWYNKAISHISYKLRTVKETRDYLKQKSDLSTEDQNRIIQKLLDNGFLNDYEYALHLMEDCKNKNRGVRYFTNQLARLGVASTIINRVTLEFNEEDILDSLINKYQKEADRLTKYPIIIQKQKLQEKMLRSGLSSSTIREVISKLSLAEDYTESFKEDLEKVKKKTTDKNKQINYLLQKGYPYEYIRKRNNEI